MCFSFEVSINSWFLVLAECIFLLAFSKNKSLSIWITAFTLTFTQIQIIEAILWNTLNTNKDADVTYIAKYIPVLLWCQPFIQSLFGYLYTNNTFLLCLSFIYLFILIVDFNYNDIFEVKISKNGHLVWKRFRDGQSISILGNNDVIGLLYLFGLIAPLFFIDSGHLVTKIGLIGFGISSFIYSLSYESGEFSSMWCYIAINYILIGIIGEFADDYIK